MNTLEAADNSFAALTNQQVKKAVGIGLDIRLHIPQAEQAALLADAKAGVETAKQLLISQRLGQFYDKYAVRAVVMERAGLEPQDLLALGILAILMAIPKVDPAKPTPNVRLSQEIAMRGERLLQSSQLAPPEVTIELQDMSDSNYPNAAIDSPESQFFVQELHQLVKEKLEQLSYMQRRVLELRYGLNGESPHICAEVGRILNVTRSNVFLTEPRSLEKLEHNCYDLYEYGECEEVNHGLPEIALSKRPSITDNVLGLSAMRPLSSRQVPVVTADQQQRQKRWLKEIEDKQARGDLTFVTGALLKLPWPPAIKARYTALSSLKLWQLSDHRLAYWHAQVNAARAAYAEQGAVTGESKS